MKLLWKNKKPMPATLELLRQALTQSVGENLTERCRLVADAVRAQFRTEVYGDCIFWLALRALKGHGFLGHCVS